MFRFCTLSRTKGQFYAPHLWRWLTLSELTTSLELEVLFRVESLYNALAETDKFIDIRSGFQRLEIHLENWSCGKKPACCIASLMTDDTDDHLTDYHLSQHGATDACNGRQKFSFRKQKRRLSNMFLISRNPVIRTFFPLRRRFTHRPVGERSANSSWRCSVHSFCAGWAYVWHVHGRQTTMQLAERCHQTSIA